MIRLSKMKTAGGSELGQAAVFKCRVLCLKALVSKTGKVLVVVENYMLL